MIRVDVSLMLVATACGCQARNPRYHGARDGAAIEAATDDAIVPRDSKSSPRDAPAPDSRVVDGQVASGPVGYWRLDEGAGALCGDSSGNGGGGTLSGAASWRAGGFPAALFNDRWALDFNGADALVTVPSSTRLSNLRSLTVAAWIKPRSAGDFGLGRIVAKRQIDDPTVMLGSGWQLYLCGPYPTHTCTGNALEFLQSFSSAEGNWRSPYDSIKLDTWQHVAVTYDRSSATSTPSLYIDGTSVAVTRDLDPMGTLADDSTQDLTIGNNQATIRAFDGLIDDVRVYDRVLAPAEIAALAAGNP